MNFGLSSTDNTRILSGCLTCGGESLIGGIGRNCGADAGVGDVEAFRLVGHVHTEEGDRDNVIAVTQFDVDA